MSNHWTKKKNIDLAYEKFKADLRQVIADGYSPVSKCSKCGHRLFGCSITCYHSEKFCEHAYSHSQCRCEDGVLTVERSHPLNPEYLRNYRGCRLKEWARFNGVLDRYV